MNFDQFNTFATDGGIGSFALALVGAVLITMLGKVVVKPLRKVLERKANETITDWDNVVLDLAESTRAWVVTVWLFSSVGGSLGLQPKYATAIKVLMIFATTVQVVIWALRAIRGWRDRKIKKVLLVDSSAAAPISLLTSVAEALVVIVLALVGLSNLGVDIAALITGLGIGGIAVGLAAQNILGDLFASFAIIFDKPFVIGDAIKVGEDTGSVEHIGLKTTRVKSLTGEQLIFSNKDLLESRIRNFKRMSERRVAMKIRVGFQTPVEKLQMIPSLVKSFFTGKEQIRFDNCHFTEITESAFSFELVWWVMNSDFELFLSTQEALYIDIISKLRKEDIAISEPTYNLHFEPPVANIPGPSEGPSRPETRMPTQA